MATKQEEFLNYLEKFSDEEIKQKTFSMYSKLEYYEKYSVLINLENNLVFRRFQYLNKQYGDDTRTLNSLIKINRESKDKILLMYLSKQYFELEKEAFSKQDYPLNLEEYPIKFK